MNMCITSDDSLGRRWLAGRGTPTTKPRPDLG